MSEKLDKVDIQKLINLKSERVLYENSAGMCSMEVFPDRSSWWQISAVRGVQQMPNSASVEVSRWDQ